MASFISFMDLHAFGARLHRHILMAQKSRIPTILALTAFNKEYREIASISVPGIQRMCGVQGYSISVVERDDCKRRGGWIKIEPIIEALNSGCDFVLWIDVDTIVARTDVDIRNEIQSNSDLYMAWFEPKPAPHADPPHFNTGVMLIRASSWSREFFKQVWEIGPLDHRWNDQAVIHHVLGYDRVANKGEDRVDDISKALVSRLDLSWNAIPSAYTLDAPIIWHFAGIGGDRRLQLMLEMQVQAGFRSLRKEL